MPYTLLVVEDEFDVRENIVEILTTNSYRVLQAANGREAVKLLLKEIPDLIISDITMPGMDGMELLEFVQNSKQYSNIPFVFLTAKSSLLDMRKGMTLGADDYLPKPFKVNELLKMVEIRLKKREKFNEQIEGIKENIALSIPHELRTPLTPILCYSGLMEEEGNNLTRDEIKEMGANIKTSAMRLRTTVEKFILYSNLHTELNKLKKDSSLYTNPAHDIEAILWKVLEDALHKNSQKNEVELAVEESHLKINEQYFSLCVSELIENSFKFAEPKSKIKITGKRESGHYELVFENAGCGLTIEQIKKIDLFNKHEHPSTPGSGLGLPIVKKIIEFFNGEFEIECKNENYTKVAVRFPYAEIQDNN